MHPLISVADLAGSLGTLTVLDVRYQLGGPAGVAEYAKGHVPGARYVDLDRDLAAPPGPGGRHPLPSAEAFQSAMQRLGVDGARGVVVYDDWGARAAGRCWWLLRYFGHGNVRVLDGGWSAWQAAGHGVETSAFPARAGGMPIVDADEVPSAKVLIDARAPERFRGDVEPIDPVAGRIPGAVNVPTGMNLASDGRFKSREELAEVYAKVGAVAGADVAAYCGSGVTAAHDVLAMEIAGVSAKLYPGSWSGWITDPTRQTERG